MGSCFCVWELFIGAVVVYDDLKLGGNYLCLLFDLLCGGYDIGVFVEVIVYFIFYSYVRYIKDGQFQVENKGLDYEVGEVVIERDQFFCSWVCFVELLYGDKSYVYDDCISYYILFVLFLFGFGIV